MIIKTESTSKVFSSLGGLLPLKELLYKTKLRDKIGDVLPELKSGADRSVDKFCQMILSFQAGAECLDDIDCIRRDEAFKILCSWNPYTSKSIGNFLRSFSSHQVNQLNHKLIENAFELRENLPKSNSITLDVDSTINRQYGKKMEGLGRAYDGTWGLDTIQAFDENGLQFWNEVRDGGTFSSQGAENIIHEIFKRLPKNDFFKKIRKYFRADSAFCNSGVFKACMAKSAGFVISMRANMFEPLINRVKNWKSQNPNNKNRILFYDNRECEIGQTIHSYEGCPEPLRVVLIRAEKHDSKKLKNGHKENYDYYGWISNIGEHELKSTKLIKFYRKRGQAENYIKELKYGYDMKHYPCIKLSANKAYGVIAAFSYNLIRFLSKLKNSKKTKYVKTFRNLWIHLPCQIVHHARQVIFRFMKHHHKEVRDWLNRINLLQFSC